MYRWARRATGRDEAFCLDVVQDAMMRIIRSLKPLQSERQLRGYLRAATQSLRPGSIAIRTTPS
jgi:DNA-directed RNA polymerase specialized sigma24 family protein